MTIRNLDALVAPKSVVLIGATSRAGSVGGTIARNLLSAGFKGRVFFVNPNRSEVLGHPCHRDLKALPEVADLAVIVTPPDTVEGLVGDLAQLGTRAVVVITAGLGADATQRMLEAGRERLVRIQGPNCIGLMLPRIGLNASFAHRDALKGDLAFLSQSGALVTAVIDWASDRGIGFSHVVSLGDMADVDFGDMLDMLAGDTQSSAILVYMEAVTNAAKFMSAARRAARAKPVIVIKAGRNASAARAAASHTGRLTGSDAAYDAAFRRAGLLRVYALSEMFEAAEMLARNTRLGGERLMVLTNGGGAGVLATDHLADAGGTLADLDPATRQRLDPVLPANWSRANPVDIIGDAGPERYAAAVSAVLEDPGCDALLAINCPTALASSTDVARAVIGAWRKSSRRPPLITNWLGESAVTEARRLFGAEGVATFDTPRSAVRGFMQLVRHMRAQDELMRTPSLEDATDGACDSDRVGALISSALARGRQMLSEADSKDILAAYGIPVAASVRAVSPEDAAAAAEPLLARYGAVVVKILSDDISHKSDVGGVVLDLTSREATKRAAEDMLARIASLRPDARIDGFTVSPMIKRPRAHELIVGMSVDETFGPLILFGAGGTSVEVVADTSLAIPPLDATLARDLVGRTRIARLLAGYRDRKPADLDAITQVLVRLSALVVRHPEIREIDINPLLADHDGVIAVDARIRLEDNSKRPRVPLVVKPYPAEWVRTEPHATLGTLVLRPIRPEDEHLYERFLARMTPEDMRLRLFAPVKEFSRKFLARLTQIDYAREIAFVATADREDGALLGVARFAADPDYRTAEYGVLVRSDLKGIGLGWMLMSRLIDYARATGLEELNGLVLAENTQMLRMCRELGFSVANVPDDPSLRHVVLRLAAAADHPR